MDEGTKEPRNHNYIWHDAARTPEWVHVGLLEYTWLNALNAEHSA